MGTKVTRSKDCGNSPKQRLIEDASVAIATADTSTIEALSLPELTWLYVGKKPLEGQEQVLASVQKAGEASEIVIDRVVSHGRVGAVNGVVTRNGKRTAFCHMFEYNNTKCTHIKAISTYVTNLRQNYEWL